MAEKSPGIWAIALVAVAGMLHIGPQFVRQETTGSSGAGAKSKPAGSQSSTAYGCDPDKDDCAEKLLKDFYAINQNGDVGSSPEDLKTRFRESESQILIATVTDPLDAHASYRFDESIESIQTGAQDAGFLLDRFDLPWPRELSSPGGSGDKPKDLPNRKKSPTKPGVMLFRRDGQTEKRQTIGTSTKLLLVFLVGETPTSGINKAMLISALDQTKGISGDPTTLRIVGPNFSGSATSLYIGLSQWFTSHSKTSNMVVDIVSGSATQPKARKALSFDFSPIVDSQRHLVARFHSTLWTDSELESAIYGHLSELGIKDNQIAILVESDSAYGQDFYTAKYDPAHYHFPFPMHISQLRTVYQRDQRLKEEAVNQYEDANHAASELSFDDPPDPKDLPPSYSPELSANTAELALTNILDAINREHIRYVGLFATDTRDKLFLARLLKNYCPNVHLFSNDSDILYIHPHFVPDVEGMLIASTYPLANQTQTWLKNERYSKTVRQFYSQSGQGIHNAVVAGIAWTNLEKKDDHKEGHDDLLSWTDNDPNDPRLSDYGEQFQGAQNHRPPIWITAVGRDEVWPLAIRRPRDQTVTVYAGSQNVYRSTRFLLAFCAVSIFFCFTAYRCLNPRTGVKDPTLSIFSEIPINSSVAGPQRFLSFAYVMTLFAAYALIAGTLALPARDLGEINQWWIWTLTGLTGTLLAVACYGSARRFVMGSTLQVDPNYKLNYPASIGLGLLSAAFGLFVFLHTVMHTDVLAYERTTNIGSGLSPVVPLAFLATGACVWFICSLKRLQTLRYDAALKLFEGSKATAGSFVGLSARVRDAVQSNWNGCHPEILFAVKALIAILVVVPIALGHFFSSLEGPVYVWTFRTLFAVLIFGVVWSAVQFFSILYQLRRLLRVLASHPLSKAFHRLPPALARGLSTQFSAAPPTLADLQEPVRELTLLKSIDPHLLKDLDISRIDFNFQVEMSQAAKEQRRRWSFMSDTQQLLFSAARELLEHLNTKWYYTRTLRKEAGASATSDRPLNTAWNYARTLLHKEAGASATSEKTATSERPDALEVCENFVASQIVAFLNYVFMHLRWLLICVGAPVLALLVAEGSYPFYPQYLMMTSTWLAIVLLTAAYLVSFIKMSRNQVLRLIATSPSGTEFDKSFLPHLIVVAVVPVLVFLVSNFPSLGQMLVGWIDPILKAFK